MKSFKQIISEAKANPLHAEDSGKLITHLNKVYGNGGKKYNIGSPGANFKSHTAELTPDGKKKMGADLKAAGWKYSKDTNGRGEVGHTYKHPHENTTVVHVDHDPKGINSHLSDHVVTISYPKANTKRHPNYVHYD